MSSEPPCSLPRYVLSVTQSRSLFALAHCKANAQVTAAGPMGVTNPTAAVMGTPINQTSNARLLSLNSANDL